MALNVKSPRCEFFFSVEDIMHKSMLHRNSLTNWVSPWQLQLETTSIIRWRKLFSDNVVLRNFIQLNWNYLLEYPPLRSSSSCVYDNINVCYNITHWFMKYYFDHPKTLIVYGQRRFTQLHTIELKQFSDKSATN